MVSLLAEMPRDMSHFARSNSVDAPMSLDDLDPELRKRVAERLRQTRMLIDGNRTRLAEKFGIHHTVLQKWEDGRAYPSEVFMVLFCNATGVTMDWIYRGVMTGLPPYLITLLIHLYPEYRTSAEPMQRAEDSGVDLLAPPQSAPTLLPGQDAPGPFSAVARPEQPTPPKRRRRKRHVEKNGAL